MIPCTLQSEYTTSDGLHVGDRGPINGNTLFPKFRNHLVHGRVAAFDGILSPAQRERAKRTPAGRSRVEVA
jgi:hypothetical protein